MIPKGLNIDGNKILFSVIFIPICNLESVKIAKLRSHINNMLDIYVA